MTSDEIKTYTSLGRNHSVCIDISFVAEIPGVLRHIEIYRNNLVWICFKSYGLDEGGASYKGKFSSLEDLVLALELYLNNPISEWKNYSKTGEYPEKIRFDPIEMNYKTFLLVTSKLLPKQGDFRR